MSFTIERTITAERMEDLLCCAFEGGIGYWAQVELLEDAGARPWRYVHELPVRGGSVTLSDSTGEGWPETAEPYLNGTSLQEGLKIMGDKHPRHMADFLAENEDAITGDVFVQCCVFGEVVFG